MKEWGWVAVVGGAVLLEVLTAPGTALSGQSWKLSRSGTPGMVHFTMQRSRAGDRYVTSTDVPLSNFRGFSLDQLGHTGPANFEFVHDAGSLLCQGKFSWGRGSGGFTLKPNAAFVSELNRMGYASPHEDEMFTMMLADVSLDFASQMRAADANATLHDLLDLRSRGITPQYIRDMTATGGHSFRAGDWIELHDHGVKARFVEDLRLAGYDLPAHQIVELADHGVNSAFVRELQFFDLRPRAAELVDLHDHGVTPEYLHALKDAGLSTLTADAAIDLKQHGVPGELAQTAQDLGYHFTAPELIDMHDHGVDSKYLRNLRDSGMHNLTEPQITQLHMHGVD